MGATQAAEIAIEQAADLDVYLQAAAAELIATFKKYFELFLHLYPCPCECAPVLHQSVRV